jgi:hypothetical protein
MSFLRLTTSNYPIYERTKDKFLPAQPIRNVLDQIKASKVYTVLKKLPKGGNMHLHHGMIEIKIVLSSKTTITKSRLLNEARL